MSGRGNPWVKRKHKDGEQGKGRGHHAFCDEKVRESAQDPKKGAQMDVRASLLRIGRSEKRSEKKKTGGEERIVRFPNRRRRKH